MGLITATGTTEIFQVCPDIKRFHQTKILEKNNANSDIPMIYSTLIVDYADEYVVELYRLPCAKVTIKEEELARVPQTQGIAARENYRKKIDEL